MANFFCGFIIYPGQQWKPNLKSYTADFLHPGTSGTLDCKTVATAIFNHPSHWNHPTTIKKLQTKNGKIWDLVPNSRQHPHQTLTFGTRCKGSFLAFSESLLEFGTGADSVVNDPPTHVWGSQSSLAVKFFRYKSKRDWGRSSWSSLRSIHIFCNFFTASQTVRLAFSSLS